MWVTARATTIATALALALAAPGTAAGAVAQDTGVVNVSRSLNYAEGEEPLSVNPLNPDQLVTVANVWQKDFPVPNPFVGGSGVQDTRVYSSRDGGRTWRAQKLD